MGRCTSKLSQEIDEDLPLAEHTFAINIKNAYEFLDFCGSGHYGVVFKAVSLSDRSKEFAIKKVNKELIKDPVELKREVSLLSELHHRNIIKIFETYEDVNYFYMVMQYCKGGTLYGKIREQGSFSEKDAAKVLKQVIKAVRYLHRNGVCHRDIKPENLLFSSSKQNRLKLIDFGLSLKKDYWSKSMSEVVGTVYYIAPEVIHGNYDMRCDVWSLGVLMFFLLSGKLPFYAKDPELVMNKIIQQNLSYTSEWNKISKEAKDLVSRLLCKNKKNRISIEDAYKHEWFQIDQKEENTQSGKILDYAWREETISKIMNHVINSMNYQEIVKAEKKFETLARAKGSILELESLLGVKFSISKSDSIINISKLLRSTIWAKLHLNEEKIFKAFQSFDAFHDKKISRSQLQELATFLEGSATKHLSSFPVKILYTIEDVMKLYKEGKRLKNKIN